MNSFYIASIIYFCGSLLLFGLMYLMGFLRRKVFTKTFGDQVTFEDLKEGQVNEWQQIHETRFDSGIWRFVMLAYMCYHYPGLLLSACLGRNTLHPMLLFTGSAMVWIGLLYLIF